MRATRSSNSRRGFLFLGVALLGILALGLHLALAAATVWNTGDVFVGVQSGSYYVYTNAGVFKEAISDGTSDYTTGCAFNAAGTKLYTTDINPTSQISVYDNTVPHTIVQTISTGSGPESISFLANSNFLVSNVNSARIELYNAAGVFQTSYATGRADWIDLAVNQTTIFFTTEGTAVKRWDTVGGAMTDFATGLSDGYALRLLAPGDGSGGLLVADGTNIKRLNSLGAAIQTYDVTGQDAWFALTLDPNGTSFWSADYSTANFYRFNIATGAVEIGPIYTGTGTNTVYGLCVKGEITAAQPTPGASATATRTATATPTATTTTTPQPTAMATIQPNVSGAIAAVVGAAGAGPQVNRVAEGVQTAVAAQRPAAISPPSTGDAGLR